MKKINFLKSIAVAAMFMVAGSGAFAQNVAAPANPKSASMETANDEYVTTGARLPYFVATDAAIQAMTTAGSMKASIFKWEVKDGATNTTNVASFLASISKYDGTAASQYDNFRTVTAGTGYFDNEIGITWDAATYATGKYVLNVTEKSVTLSSTMAGCDGNTTTKDVYVLARPTVAFNGTEGGGCSIAPNTDFYVPLKIKGLGGWTVTYTVAYNGGTASTPATYDLTMTAPTFTSATVVATAAADQNADGTAASKTDGLKIHLPSAQYGYYDVAITDIQDNVSKKSLNTLTASPASGTFRIYVLPTPTTNAIQHVKNL